MLFLCGIALIFVSLLVLDLLTGAGAYIKHKWSYTHSVQYIRFRRHLHDNVFMQKRRDLSLFYPFVYTNTMKTHMLDEDF